jgi:Tat protein translocase TatB subunit
MFGIGMPEMLLILAVALIVIGPKKLPELAKTLGRAMRELKRATSDFKETLQVDDDFSDVKKTFDDIQTDIKDSVDITASFQDKAAGEEDPADIQAEKGAAETADDENLTNQKSAFEELNDDKPSPEGAEKEMKLNGDKDSGTDAAETEKKEEKLAGRSDDA